eukprot:scaffold167757_cov37-Tisochrysis_lutea.AAC.1
MFPSTDFLLFTPFGVGSRPHRTAENCCTPVRCRERSRWLAETATERANAMVRGPNGETPREEGREMHERPRAVAQRMAKPERMPNRALTPAETAVINQEAVLQGFKWAGIVGANVGSILFMIDHYSPRFRNGIGISGKVGLFMIPTFFTFCTQSHLVVARANANPFKYMQH